MAEAPRARRTLVAGFGNELRADDGFGIEVLRRLRERGPMAGVDLIEIGTAGIRLAQELLTPYDRLVIVDAMSRGGAPGTVYVVEVQEVERPDEVDLHLAVPSRALALAKALGALPPEVYIVGCEPGQVDELTMALTPAVAAAVDAALAHVDRLLPASPPIDAGDPRSGSGRIGPFADHAPPSRPSVDPVERMRRRDEILQIMFWVHGEGLGPDVAPADILRFMDDPDVVHATLEDLVREGYAEPLRAGDDDVRYRLTPDGLREGRRRFLDEFEPYLARHAHGECGSADCDCHRGGAASCQGLA
jgi:hydrogenase maturation protease